MRYQETKSLVSIDIILFFQRFSHLLPTAQEKMGCFCPAFEKADLHGVGIDCPYWLLGILSLSDMFEDMICCRRRMNAKPGTTKPWRKVSDPVRQLAKPSLLQKDIR